MNDITTRLELAQANRDFEELERIALEDPATALNWLDEQRTRARNHVERLADEIRDGDRSPELREAKTKALGYLRASGVLRQKIQFEMGRLNRVEKRESHTLRAAIRNHLEASLAADIDPEPHDLELWALVTDTAYDEIRAMRANRGVA